MSQDSKPKEKNTGNVCIACGGIALPPAPEKKCKNCISSKKSSKPQPKG